MKPGADLDFKTVHYGDETHRIRVRGCRLSDGWWRGYVALYGQLHPVVPVGAREHYRGEMQHPSHIERWRACGSASCDSERSV